jgi:hypothetical protein
VHGGGDEEESESEENTLGGVNERTNERANYCTNQQEDHLSTGDQTACSMDLGDERGRGKGIYLTTHQPTYQPTNQPTNLPTYLPTYFKAGKSASTYTYVRT